MTGNDLFFLIQGLNDISEKMEQIRAGDGFSMSEEYPISGYMVEKIRNTCNKACNIIDSTDFMPYHPRNFQK